MSIDPQEVGNVYPVCAHPRWRQNVPQPVGNEEFPEALDLEQWRFEQAIRRELSGDD